MDFPEISAWAAGFPLTLLHVLVALIILIGGAALYAFITPHREITLIREGNTAAALSFGGVLVGIALPLAFALGYSVHVVLGNLVVVVVLKRLLPEVRLTRRLWAGVVAAVAAALFGRWALLPWLTSGLLLTAAVLCMALVFVAIAVLLDRSLLVAIRSLSSKERGSPS